MQKVIIKNISKKFKIGFSRGQSALGRLVSSLSGREPKKIINILNNISFNADSGEIIGLIGKNGSGKSTLLRIVAGIYKQDKGDVWIGGKLISLIGLGAGLQHRLTMKDNIFLVGSLFDLNQKTIKQRFNSIVNFAGLNQFVNTKLYQFSEGMKQRLAFSIAIHCDPEVLLLDEVFEIGDEDFRHKSAEKIKELVKKGATIILVSHEMWMIEKYCDRVIWLDKGNIFREGNTKDVVKEYKK
jgi:ABC-type polysaccharide/polyol phosphate transport system ATPase subunit